MIMIDHNLSYVEAIPDQTYFDSWKEIQLNTGGTQSTLQDIRITERADGFCYKDCDTSRYFTRNRFIYWKICHDALELVEQSLDVNLYSNRIRYRFVDTPILDGVSIHETKDHVVLLVPTVCSVHKLIFPHPRKLHKQDKLLGASKELKYPSIFSEAVGNESKDTNTFYVFSVPKFTDTQTPQLACSTLGPNGEGLFFLAYPSGDLLLVSHLSSTENSTVELKTDSVVPRFLSGLAEKFISKSSEYTGMVSLSLMTLGGEIFGLSLCRGAELKFWSISRKQCVAVVNIFAESGDTVETIKNSQNYVLRKAVDGDDVDCIFGVFVNFVTESKFIILKPVIIGDHIEVRRLFTIHSPERDLIDFTLSATRLWSVWRTETGSCVVYNSNLNPDNYDSNTWAPVILENLPDSNQIPVHEGDPRQIYLQQIFHPGRFPLHIINKALSIYKKSTLAADVNLSASSLKQRICLAVENEIRNELKEAEVSDEDYLECANWCWQRFYSCCVQYHVAGLKPLGLLLLPSVSGAVLLKKSNISFLRPMDPLEHMVLCNEYTSKSQLLRYNLLSSENVDMIKQVLQLVNVIVYLEQQVSENFDYAFEKELLNLKSPEVIVAELIEKIQMEMDSEFCSGIIERLNQIHHLDQVIYKILDILKFEVDMFDEPFNNDSLQLYFSSHLGISVLAKCIQQQAKVRFTISRNLLLITNILTNSKVIERNILEGIRSVCTPDLILYTQANFVVVWLSSLPALSFLPQESIFQRLSPLKLNPTMSINRNISHPVSLLELFISSVSGGELSKIPIEEDVEYSEMGHWHLSLIPFVNRLFHIVWPISKNTLLAEWLLVNGQHVWLEQYVRLLKSWCEWGSNTRCFVLGVSFLICGDHYKATECFQLAAKGLFSEKFFTTCILRGVKEDSESETYMTYYLKVIKLLELHGAKDFAIQVANTALRRIGDSETLAATLYSIKFKHHLSLKHYEMAFYSLNSNPDAERKKDSLRDLVKKLLDERKFDVLLKFTYGSLQELFCNILFTRARAADAINNVYYDFLYTYLVTLGSPYFRKAASVMYEQAFRLGHANTLPALEKQVKCLLASYNVLKLVNSKYSWVVKPAPESSNAETVVIPGRAGTENEDIVLNLKQSVEVVDADDIRKESIVLTAKLKLCKFDEKYFHPDTSPEELIYLLASAGFFKDALSIAELYKAPFTPVFEILTSQCIMLSESDDTTDCMWLIENDLQDLAIKKNAAGVAWNLLQDFIEKYEEDKMSVLHSAVCKKMVDMRIHIPYWFLSSYKKRNPSELLRLLHFYGRLQEAVDVAKEYLLAVMGHGSENYGITQQFLATSPPVCFPVRQVDALLYELELQNEKYPDGKYVKEHAILKDMFTHYLTTATRLCIEKCRLGV